MDKTTKVVIAAQLLAGQAKVGFLLSDPVLVGQALDVVDALEAELEKRDDDAAAAQKAAADAAAAAAKAAPPAP